MPRPCSICTHSCHRAIDEAMIAGEPFRRIASHFETSEASVRRHRVHVGAKITKAAQIRESADGANLLDRLEALQVRTLQILSREGGNDRITLAAIREARENLKLIGEFTGKLREGPTVNVGVFSRSPQDAEAARERILSELARLATSRSPVQAQQFPPV